MKKEKHSLLSFLMFYATAKTCQNEPKVTDQQAKMGKILVWMTLTSQR